LNVGQIFFQCQDKLIIQFGFVLKIRKKPNYDQYFSGLKLNNEIVKQYKLPDLPFDYADLEPYIDRETVTVHHQGHHAAYTKKYE
jgi:hypothetical protein